MNRDLNKLFGCKQENATRRVSVFVGEEILSALSHFSAIFVADKSSVIRLLLNFGIRKMPSEAVDDIVTFKLRYGRYNHGAFKLDVRIPQTMEHQIQQFAAVANLSLSMSVKCILLWSLENCPDYTISDFLT